MDDAAGLIFLLLLLILFLVIALPIVAIVISISTRKKLKNLLKDRNGIPPAPDTLSAAVQQLTTRVARLEAMISGMPAPPVEPVIEPPAAQPPTIFEPSPAQPVSPTTVEPTPVAAAPTIPAQPTQPTDWEAIIGRRWVAWAAVALIVFATAFFFKYAFDNRWIGELGRVAIGVAAGIALAGLGYRYHKRGWRVFSQILSGGGVVLLYLSAYASFGYYHLASQKAAFVYLAVLIAETAGLALLYNAPVIAVMALLGGFLVPLLLHSDRDQYGSFFSYIGGLDAGALSLLQHWAGLSALAFAGTHFLFWLWYVENYHPRKLPAVMIFHFAVFLLFLAAYLARRLRRVQPVNNDGGELSSNNPFEIFARFEDFGLVLANPFVFFATGYYFLNPNYHDWMGVFAIGMALVYAGAAKILLDRSRATRTELLLMIGVALTFVTLAIPIQLKANWIAMAWAMEGLLVLWGGLETESWRLRICSYGLFALALVKLIFWDTPYATRPPFIPVANKYFLSSLFVIACVFAAAFVNRRLRESKEPLARAVTLTLATVAIVTLWLVISIEMHTYFVSRAAQLHSLEDVRHERWLGQMALSVIWSVYAAVLAAIGFVRRTAAIRWVALSLFALTVIKVMMIDIAVLKQLYRIIAFLVLGLLLLVVAWGYHKAFQSRS